MYDAVGVMEEVPRISADETGVLPHKRQRHVPGRFSLVAAVWEPTAAHSRLLRNITTPTAAAATTTTPRGIDLSSTMIVLCERYIVMAKKEALPP